MTHPLLLTLPEAGRALSVDARTVRRMISRGDLALVRVGRLVRVSVADLQAFVARQSQRVDTPAGTTEQGEEIFTCEKRQETKTESLNVGIRRTGGPRHQTAAAVRLADLLEFDATKIRTGKRPAPSGQGG
jgi:excisionase family DNA binding protein